MLQLDLFAEPGRSMVPLLKGETVADWRKSQFYTYWGAPDHHGIRTARYTYVKIKGHSAELFDRQDDPDQCHDVAGKEEHKAVLAELETELQRRIAEVGISADDLPGGATKGP